jgi:hypothetical protein
VLLGDASDELKVGDATDEDEIVELDGAAEVMVVVVQGTTLTT